MPDQVVRERNWHAHALGRANQSSVHGNFWVN